VDDTRGTYHFHGCFGLGAIARHEKSVQRITPWVFMGISKREIMKIDDKTKQLIAIGVSVAINCQPCLKFHHAKAKEAGACDEGIADAVAVAKMVRKGATSTTDKFVATILQNASGCVGSDDCSQV
jgi:AhpD family alkylhydroperoxidase